MANNDAAMKLMGQGVETKLVKMSDGSEQYAPVQMALTALVPATYDAISLSYTGGNLTQVIYQKDGSTVCTLVLAYNGSNELIAVARV